MTWKPLGTTGLEYMNINGGTLYRVIATNQVLYVPASEEIAHLGVKKLMGG